MSQFGDQSFACLQYLLPKHALSRIIYRVMRTQRPWLRKRLLAFFLRHYQVNMDEAVVRDPYAYASFNSFFTRALNTDARPISSDARAFVSPVDGTVSQCGTIERHGILQAKGRTFSLLELLGGEPRAQKYIGGSFATIYLAPYNYHRIHMPYSGRVRETIYLPGDLFSVNAATARTVPRLFARNERVVCDFDASPSSAPPNTEKGKNWNFAMVYVGALFVGSMETTWSGEVNPPPRRQLKPIVVTTGVGRSLGKGEEAGRFNMGSTVVIVVPPNRVTWSDQLRAGAIVRMGEKIGTVTV